MDTIEQNEIKDQGNILITRNMLIYYQGAFTNDQLILHLLKSAGAPVSGIFTLSPKIGYVWTRENEDYSLGYDHGVKCVDSGIRISWRKI